MIIKFYSKNIVNFSYTWWKVNQNTLTVLSLLLFVCIPNIAFGACAENTNNYSACAREQAKKCAPPINTGSMAIRKCGQKLTCENCSKKSLYIDSRTNEIKNATAYYQACENSGQLAYFNSEKKKIQDCLAGKIPQPEDNSTSFSCKDKDKDKIEQFNDRSDKLKARKKALNREINELGKEYDAYIKQCS